MLTPRIIADLRSGDECADPDYPGLRVRRTNAARVFFYRYRASDGALREIKLGEFGPMTLAARPQCGHAPFKACFQARNSSRRSR